MELLQLTYFCDAASTQNFSQTAKRFNVPPSNISQSVKRLEKELGVELFSRSGNKVMLNSRGERFYHEVKNALNMLEHARKSACGAGEAGELRLGVHVGRRVVMRVASIFQQEHPEVSLVMENAGHDLNHDFDLIVSDGSFSHPNFVRRKVFREKILLAAKKGFFEKAGPRTGADIMGKPFITMRANYSMYNITREICDDLGFEPHIALQSEDPIYVRRCVNLGLGITFVPTLSWRGLFSQDVELWDVGEYHRDICIYVRKNGFTPEYVNRFYDLLIRCFEYEESQLNACPAP